MNILEISQLLNKYVPLEMLAQMPLPFVHRLRDLQLKRLEEKNKQREHAMAATNAANSKQPTLNIPPMDHEDVEELIEGLT